MWRKGGLLAQANLDSNPRSHLVPALANGMALDSYPFGVSVALLCEMEDLTPLSWDGWEDYMS